MYQFLCYDTNDPDEFLPTLRQPLHPLFHVTPFANDSASNSRSACWKYFAVSTPCYVPCQTPPPQHTLESTYLVMVYKVEHGHDVQKDTSISRVPCSHTLHVVCELCSAVKWLASLNPVNHLAHVLVNFPLVFRHAVESHCTGSVSLEVLFMNPQRPVSQVVGVLVLQV